MSIEIMELFDIFSKTYTKAEAQTIVKDIESLVSDHKKELATKSDLHEVELRLTKEIAEVRSSVIKWMIGFIISQTAIILTIITLLKLA